MLKIAGALLLALFVVPAPWGIVLIGSAIVAEVAETAFWLRYTKRNPPAVGREALIGRPVEVVAPCQPAGKVRLWSERWNAHCTEGAAVGDTVIVDAVDELTLVVRQPASGSDQRRILRPSTST